MMRTTSQLERMLVTLFFVKQANQGVLLKLGAVQIGRIMTHCLRILLLQRVDAEEKKMHGVPQLE